MTVQPALFLSHGAPDLALAEVPARRFLGELGRQLERPDAILIASAHHEAGRLQVRAPGRFVTRHDFGNFDRRLFDMRYEPPGAPALAAQAFELLKAAGLDPAADGGDRIDHGAWVPLSLLFPDADTPVAMLSIDPDRDARYHESVGSALAPLRQRNILVIGSGSISHNLSAVFSGAGATDRAWVEEFTEWLEAAVRRSDREALLDAIERAPEAARNHPTDEHLLPFYVAMGAGGAGAVGKRLHHSFTYNVLAMDVYAFGEAGTVESLAS